MLKPKKIKERKRDTDGALGSSVSWNLLTMGSASVCIAVIHSIQQTLTITLQLGRSNRIENRT